MTCKEIILATNNPGKQREFSALFTDFPLTFISQGQLAIPSPPETGISFVENALIKARHAANLSGLPALADDSGLCVACLDDAPGLYSAVYAGEGANDEANREKLINMLHAYEAPYLAKFVCLIVFIRFPEDPLPIICQGEWAGEVILKPSGDKGFGYDPIFYDPGVGKTAAELLPALKNQLSHRGKAVSILREKLKIWIEHNV